MALRDNTPAQLLTDSQKALNALCVRGLIIALAFLGSAIPSRGEEARTPGSSQPPDTAQYQRPAIPMDLSVARQKRPTVRAPNAPNASPLGNPSLLKLIDVNASAPGSDTVSRTEPSIAVNPEHPNVIVVHQVVLATGPDRNALRFLFQPTARLVGPVYV